MYEATKHSLTYCFVPMFDVFEVVLKLLEAKVRSVFYKLLVELIRQPGACFGHTSALNAAT